MYPGNTHHHLIDSCLSDCKHCGFESYAARYTIPLRDQGKLAKDGGHEAGRLSSPLLHSSAAQQRPPATDVINLATAHCNRSSVLGRAQVTLVKYCNVQHHHRSRG